MICHQAIGMADPAIAGYNVSKGLKKQLTLDVIEKDLLAGIAPTGHMINRAGKLQPKWSCNAAFAQPPFFFVGWRHLTADSPAIA